MSIHARETVLELLLEYVLITLPVLVYVGLEALHHQSVAYLTTSPEWSVATMFLLLQTFRLQNKAVASDFSRNFSELLVIVLLVFAIAASINIHMSMQTVPLTWGLVATKWALFVAASAMFVYIAGAAIYARGEES